ncbi:MAG: hypothetical protein ACXABY_09195 [Candidatus Thorarchaeota archaeon]
MVNKVMKTLSGPDFECYFELCRQQATHFMYHRFGSYNKWHRICYCETHLEKMFPMLAKRRGGRSRQAQLGSTIDRMKGVIVI